MKNSSVTKEKRLATVSDPGKTWKWQMAEKTPNSFSCHIAILCNLISKSPSLLPYKH